MKRVLQVLLAAIVSTVSPGTTGAADNPGQVVHALSAAVCRAGGGVASAGQIENDAQLRAAVAAAYGGARLEFLSAGTLPSRGPVSRQEFRFAIPQAQFRLILGRTNEGLKQIIAIEASRSPRGNLRPERMLVSDRRCAPRAARALRYGDGAGPESLDDLHPDFSSILRSIPLDQPVPRADEEIPWPEADTVSVALVDSGVNYMLPSIGERLARGPGGALIGYDFRDLDPRPFDAEFSISPFSVRRHGTQTASVILQDAPLARIAPFRYPRGHMERMADLVTAVAQHDIRIVNVSTGSARPEDWAAYEAAVRAHPRILFVASAGNGNLDLSESAVYPAALNLPNQLTVTSAKPDGSRAQGANYGSDLVDIAVPAEGRLGIDFEGNPKLVSGTSYAAARVSALAACLLGLHPEWGAAELKAAILAMSQALPEGSESYTRAGYLAEPTARRRGVCLPSSAPPKIVARQRWEYLPSALTPVRSPVAPEPDTELDLNVVLMRGNRWTPQRARNALAEAGRILAQCGVRLARSVAAVVAVEPRFQYLRDDVATEFLTRFEVPRPALVFHRESQAPVRFDAVTFGFSNTVKRPALRHTIWLTEDLQDEGVAIAHELFHLLADNGQHVTVAGNLMLAKSNPLNFRLTDDQCHTMVRRGRQLGLLRAAEASQTSPPPQS